MEIFLVGGAVRDELLGRPIKERDWVVVGATPEQLIAKKYQPVGKDFPVFLHPETHEEYALARTERKTSKGYKGFQFYATPEVTLLEDLKRRDLTINAMAKSQSGEIIDPYDGQDDLQARWLRHVSEAFAEDPVRILRIARFASTLPCFQVHPETNVLMQQMVSDGEVDALVAERVWKELSRALMTEAPQRFFEVLQACDALPVLFPGLVSHQAGIAALSVATDKGMAGSIRFACLLHGLSEKKVVALCQRYRVPKEYSELAVLVAKYLSLFNALSTTDAKGILDMLRAADAFRRPNRFLDFVSCCHLILEENVMLGDILQKALAAAKAINPQALVGRGLKGPEIAQGIYQLQLDAVKESLQS